MLYEDVVSGLDSILLFLRSRRFCVYFPSLPSRENAVKYRHLAGPAEIRPNMNTRRDLYWVGIPYKLRGSAFFRSLTAE